MKRNRTFLSLAVLAVFLPCLSLALVQAPQQEEKKPEQRLADLEGSLSQMTERIVELESKVADLNAFNKALSDNAGDLIKAIELSRKNGFEWAGPNPRSKADLLDGLKNFAALIQKAAKSKK
jgi:hypothetical protein